MRYGELEKVMPHRWPMLLVDEVRRLEEWSYVEGIKNVTGTDPCFGPAHSRKEGSSFAYPPSLLIESFGQTGGVLINKKRAASGVSKDVVMLFVGLMGFRFFGSVLPGDTMIHRVRLDKEVDDFAVLSGTVSVGDRKVAEADGIIVAYRPASDVNRVGG